MINNVETFANVPQILARGVEWYKAAGVGGSRGWKFVGVSGHVKRPGVFEVPMGTPMREVIFGRAGGISWGTRVESIRAIGAIFGLFAGFDGGCAAGFQSARRGWIDARLRGDCGVRRHNMHAGHGADGGAFLSQRIVREMCALPHGFAKDGGPADRWTQGGVSEAQYRADLSLLEELSQAMA